MDNNHEPLISVIIAVYNPGKYLRPCLDSIINQTYKNLEIILVDDGSTDDSLAICNEYAEKDNRIIVHHKENSGVSATRNQGIRLAHGDYFSFIDSDDYLEPDAYEYLISIIKEHNVDAVNYEHFITYYDKEITHKLPENYYGLFDRNGSISQLVHNVMFAWNKLFSKRIIESVWFNENVCRGEDSLFSIQAFDRADRVWFDSRPLYHYLQSEDSAVRGSFRESQLTAVNLIPIYDSFFSERYPDLYDYQMGYLMNLMINLYFDAKHSTKKFTSEQKMLVGNFKKLYRKTNIKKLSKKRRTAFRIFLFSPMLSYIIRRTNITIRKIVNMK